MIDPDLCEFVESWRLARAARAATTHGDHDWANAEVSVRFWSQEFRERRSAQRVAGKPSSISGSAQVTAAR